MSKPDGGPAFPRRANQSSGHAPGSPSYEGHAGMSLRDYFAGQALAGYVNRYGPDDVVGVDPFRELAEAAYGIADAMLAEREK